MACIRGATDAVEGLATGVGALEVGVAAAGRTVEQFLPLAARRLPDVLGFGGTNRRSFDVAAGVDEGRGAIAGHRPRARALGMLPSAIDIDVGAGPGMADKP